MNLILSCKQLRIKDFVSRIGSGVTPKGGAEVYVDKGTPFLRSQNVHDGEVRLEEVSFIDEETNDKMKGSQIRPGDVLFNLTGASIARAALVPESLKTANISQHIAFLRTKRINKKFLEYQLRSHSTKDYVMMTQVGASKEAFNHSQVLTLPIRVPSTESQTQIAEYLDRKTEAIDKKIELLRKKADLYKELRKSLINETVCRGLDKNAPMKDSGIDWIGEIPEHWEVRRGKDVFKEVSRKGLPDEPLLAASQKQGVVLKSMLLQKSMTAQKDFHAFKLVEVGDFVISLRSFEGGFEYAYYQGIISPVYTVFRVTPGLHNGYYRHLFKTELFIGYLQSRITGIRDGQSIKFTEVQNSFFPIPPEQEQQEIAEHLDKKCSIIDQIIENISNQIDTLTELRKTLINDVVTGKINVRELT